MCRRNGKASSRRTRRIFGRGKLSLRADGGTMQQITIESPRRHGSTEAQSTAEAHSAKVEERTIWPRMTRMNTNETNWIESYMRAVSFTELPQRNSYSCAVVTFVAKALLSCGIDHSPHLKLNGPPCLCAAVVICIQPTSLYISGSGTVRRMFLGRTLR